MPKPKPRGLPLGPDLGGRIGFGQDNVVHELLRPAEKPHLRVPLPVVVKVGHDKPQLQGKQQERHENPREAAWRGVQYKKNKYDILKYFLGDHIPNSLFVLTTANVSGSNNKRYVEMTLQDRVPQTTLNSLTAEQKADPRLKTSMNDLLGRMQYMYGVLGEVNARSAHNINLDAKMDLGGVSDVVKAERLDHAFTDEEVDGVIQTNASPNLLVDPESMQLYCVDFDQGQWVDGMADAKKLAFEIDARNQMRQGAVGAVALAR